MHVFVRMHHTKTCWSAWIIICVTSQNLIGNVLWAMLYRLLTRECRGCIERHHSQHSSKSCAQWKLTKIRLRKKWKKRHKKRTTMWLVILNENINSTKSCLHLLWPHQTELDTARLQFDNNLNSIQAADHIDCFEAGFLNSLKISVTGIGFFKLSSPHVLKSYSHSKVSVCWAK